MMEGPDSHLVMMAMVVVEAAVAEATGQADFSFLGSLLFLAS